jgi:hypothetical protein
MRQIFLTSEEAQKRPTLLRNVVADRTLQHRIRLFDGVKYRPLRDRSLHLDGNLVADVRQRP